MSVIIQESATHLEPPRIKYSLGIDFGTTFCCVATCDPQGRAKVLGPLIPSRIAYHDDTTHVGHDCPETHRTLRSIKGLMDTDTAHKQRTDSLWQDHSPFDAAVAIFKAIKKQSIDHLNMFVPHAVVTVPAYFDENKRQTIKQAAEHAGFYVLRLISEPTAAALCYTLKKEGLYGVYDLGGGTFDFSILKMRHAFFRVLATGGHPSLGGDTIDQSIADRLFPKDPLGLIKARAVKEDPTQTVIDLEPIIRPIVTQTLAICDQTLRDANLKREDLQALILVGGSTKMPALVQPIRAAFPQTIDQDLDPDRSIAKGAALYAHHLTQESPFLLLDVTPLSLGIETQGGLVERLIHRNTPLPCEKEMLFTTGQHGQTGITVHVVQGEGEMVSNCHSLGSFDLKNLPALTKGSVKVAIKFALDTDGLLTVSATETSSGRTQNILLNPSGNLSPKMVTQQIDSEGNDIWDRLWTQKVHQVKDAVAEIRRLLKTHPWPDMEQACNDMEKIYATQDIKALDHHWNALSAMALPLFEQSVTASLKRALEKDLDGFDT
jgi:molecular chaperone HscA